MIGSRLVRRKLHATHGTQSLQQPKPLCLDTLEQRLRRTVGPLVFPAKLLVF
jgi:hypothetical protein